MDVSGRPGLAHMLRTGHPADGSQSVGQDSAQELVNPPSHNPTDSAVVRRWIRHRSGADAQMQAAGRSSAQRREQEKGSAR